MVTLAQLQQSLVQAEHALEAQRAVVVRERSRQSRMEEGVRNLRALIESAPVFFEEGSQLTLQISEELPQNNSTAPTMREAIEAAARARVDAFTVQDLLDDIVAAHPNQFSQDQKSSLSSIVSKMARGDDSKIVTVKPGGPNDPAKYEWRDSMRE